MSWPGVWTPRAWNGSWFGQAAAAPPVTANDAAGALLVQLSARATLEEIDGLRGVLEITQNRTATMNVAPVFRGDDVDMLLTVLDADGDPTSITGDAIEVQVKQILDGPDPAIISKSVGSGVTLLAQIGDTLGQAMVSFTGADTDIEQGNYWIDVVHIRAGKRTHVIGPRSFPVRAVVNQR